MIFTRKVFAIIFISIFLFSCNNENVSPKIGDNVPNIRALSLSEQELVSSSNNFAFNIFKQVNVVDNDKNIFISPLSIGTALAMTYNGAAGNTKEEFRHVLGFKELADEELNKAYKDLKQLLLNLDKKTQFNIANSIWFKNTYTLKDGFSAVIKENYGGEIKPLDFDDPQSKDFINKWVEDKTQNKIKDLIKEINTDHRMYLVNAMYFKSTWKYKFEKSATKPMDFYLSDGTVVKRSMMFSDKIEFLYAKDDQVQLINLPYGNEQFYMSILLPYEDVSINEVIDNLKSDKFNALLQKSDTSYMHLYLPKFKLEYEIALDEVLKQLGIKDAFEYSNADFSELFVELKPLCISKVNHKTYIEVDEEGTEAAAATSVEVSTFSATSLPPSLHINRPFILLIREKSTENILFAGKVLDPNGN